MKPLNSLLLVLMPLHAEATDIKDMDQAVRAGDLERVSSLIEGGVDPSIVLTEGRNKVWEHSPLILATRSNHAEMVRLLVEKGADVNYVNVGSATALKEAAKNDNAEIAAVLIENGADVGFVDENEVPVLFWATSQKSKSVIPLLISAGADPDKEYETLQYGVITVRGYFQGKGEAYSAVLELFD